MTIKDLVKDNVVEFQFYKKGLFYYNVRPYEAPIDIFDEVFPLTDNSENIPAPPKRWQFTIPLEDIGDGVLLKEDKALTYMRWIRKAMDTNTLIEIK